MKPVQEDTAFIHRMQAVARDAGLMRQPAFDAVAVQLVDADLRLDLLNVWHLTQQLTHPDTDAIVDSWIRPQHLGHACCFGRVDVVQDAIAAGRPLNGEDYDGNPIAAAIGAYVVTPLHVRCVDLLFTAGAVATLEQFDAYNAESVGSVIDFEMLKLLLDHAGRSDDPLVRARAEAWRSFRASPRPGNPQGG